LTLETASFFCGVGVALRVADLGVAFLLLSVDFRVAVAFLDALGFASLRAGAFAALARLAFGRADFVLITRFAALAEARLADGREVDRRKPFVRLLLMWISRDCSNFEQRKTVRSLP